ncbi:MAG: exodeoxyribonuclease VII large subunit, partial [Candidatus Acidiferrales bacterium]
TGELRASLERAVSRKRRRYAVAQVRIASLDLRARVGRLRRRLERDTDSFVAHARRYVVLARRKLEAASVRLEERSPFQLLERGYAIAYDANGRVLRSVDRVATGDEISVRLANGEIGATVHSKKNIRKES